MNKQATFRILCVCLFLLLHHAGWAQSELKKANNHFRSQEFALAIAAYQQVITGKEPNLAIAQNLAQAYYRINNTREAETWLAKVLTFPGHNPQYIYLYAEVLRSNGKYPEAKTQYQAYAAKKPDAAKTLKERLQAIDSTQSWLAKPPLFTLKPEAALNSAHADFSPAFFDKGLLFTSDRPTKTTSTTAEVAGLTGRPFLKLFYAEKTANNTWIAPAPLETVVNAATHNGPATTTSANNIIYFTRTIRQQAKTTHANTDPTNWADEDQQQAQVNRLAIYTAEKRSGKWINLRPFAYNKVAAYSVGHPALSPDGRYLYFVSDMPGGRGQTDIYYCERRSGNTWSKPINAGPAINTSGRESFPVVHADGTLYFASDGHAGMGGLDLFSAKGSKAAWKGVTNLQLPFNSPKDDFGILFDKDAVSGYLSSNRDSEDGTDDIYQFELVNKQ